MGRGIERWRSGGMLKLQDNDVQDAHHRVCSSLRHTHESGNPHHAVIPSKVGIQRKGEGHIGTGIPYSRAREGEKEGGERVRVDPRVRGDDDDEGPES